MGIEKFDFFLKQLENQLELAAANNNPAQELFKIGTRTPLFMLEALAKLYSKLHNPKLFDKLKDQFKQLEDILGDIDYYHNYIIEFTGKPGISPGIIDFLKNRKEENILLLNDTLVEKKWLKNNKSRIEKIREKLSEATWMGAEEEMSAIKNVYFDSIQEIHSFYNSAAGRFTDLENQVHALRRKLRWLSIYPQALRGAIQLTDSNIADENISKYLIAEVINSPFNQMQAPGENKYILLLEKNYFLALSWIISELGKLKDLGLSEIAKEEAMTSISGHIHNDQVLNNDTVSATLLKATEISKYYFDEQNLDKMVGQVIPVEMYTGEKK